MDLLEQTYHSDLIEHYTAEAEKAGLAGHRGRVKARVMAALHVERDAREGGLKFDRERVRAAIVHSEQWTMITGAYAAEITDALRSIRRWVAASAVILVLILLAVLASF